RVTDAAGKPLTLHRIYLSDRGGKAAIEEPKKMRPYPSDREFTGAHIRLGPTRPIIGIAEGVETALAGRLATGLSVWAGIFDSGVANFLPPEDVAGVVVFADTDQSKAGEEAAVRLQERMAEHCIAVKTFFPPARKGVKNVDWNDV